MKRCPDCLQYKPLSDFPRNLRTKSGYTTYCKLCHNARGSETRQRLYGGRRHYHLKRRYGIGAAEFDMSEPTRCGGGRRRLLSMAGRIFGRAQGAPTYPMAAVEAQHLPSAEVLRAMDDERRVRRLRRRLRLWRLFGRVR